MPLFTYSLNKGALTVFSVPHRPVKQATLHPFFSEDTGDSVESLAIIKVNNIPCSLFVHQASHLITEDYSTGQTCLFLFIFMLSIHNSLLVSNFFGKISRIISSISSQRKKWSRLTSFPQTFLLAFLEDSRDISFVIFLNNLLLLLWPFKGDQGWSHNYIDQIPLHSWVHPIINHGCVYVWFI